MESSIMIIKKSIEKDAKNWWDANNRISYGLDFSQRCPKEIRDKIKGKKYEEVRNYIKSIIKEKYRKETGFKFLKEKFLPYWKTKEEEIIKRLNQIHKNPLPVKSIIIYYTSFMRSPYGKEGESFWLQLNEFNSDKDMLSCIVIHELMHLYFLKYYANFCLKAGLTNSQKEDLKEAFSVLINEEFKDLIKFEDKGYEMHKKLREAIVNKWRETKDFQKTLILGINFIKNNK